MDAVLLGRVVYVVYDNTGLWSQMFHVCICPFILTGKRCWYCLLDLTSSLDLQEMNRCVKSVKSYTIRIGWRVWRVTTICQPKT